MADLDLGWDTSLDFASFGQPVGGGASDGGGIGIAASADISVTKPPQVPSLLVRPFTINSLLMPDVPIIGGHPHDPLVWLNIPGDFTLTQGPGHIRHRADPDPADPDNDDPWGKLVEPTYYWTMRDLAPPEDENGYSMNEWPEHDGGPSWFSEWDYRPTVAGRNAYGKKSSVHTWTTAVHFNPSTADHMWTDLGYQAQPFTWIFAGIINSYPTRTYGHYILDAGKEPPYHWAARDDHYYNEGLPHRTLMLYQRSSALLFTDMVVEGGQYVRVPHNYVPRPRVMYGVFASDHSLVGWRDPAQHMYKYGKVSDKAGRYFISGRRNNNVSDNLASHITLFEIRFFSQKLTLEEIGRHYKQLAGTYKFSMYGEQ